MENLPKMVNSVESLGPINLKKEESTRLVLRQFFDPKETVNNMSSLSVGSKSALGDITSWMGWRR